jgi:hypothetical protein
MLQAAAFQMSLTCDGFGARGAIAIGDVFADRKIVFGPALIEAYEHEQIAKYPRIVLAPSALAHALAHIDYYSRVEHAPQNDEILFDLVDQCAFIDYLSCWSGSFDDEEHARQVLLPAKLEKHRKFVEDNLSRHRQRKVRSKYLWLAKYHNYVVANRPVSGRRVAGIYHQSRFATLLEVRSAGKRASKKETT